MGYFCKNYDGTDITTIKIGNFMGEEITDEPFVFSEYLKKNGLHASRSRLYLLTTGGSIPDTNKVDGQHATRSNSPNGDDECEEFAIASASHSNENSHESWLCIEGKPNQSLFIELLSHVQSLYSNEISTLVTNGWNSAFEMRSEEYLDETIDEYDPLEDKCVVTGLQTDEKVYLARKLDENDGYDLTYPSAKVAQIPQDPVVLHGPDEIYGHEDGKLFIGMVTNFQNEIVTMFTWYQNGNGLCNGHNQCIIQVKEPGAYYCKVLYGEVELMSSAVNVVSMQKKKVSMHLRAGQSKPEVSSQLQEITFERLNVDLSDIIGRGAYGTVFRGKWVGTDVAVKRIRRAKSFKGEVMREAQIHSKLHHPNIVICMGVSSRKKDVALVTELVEGDTLQHVIDEEIEMEPSVQIKIISGIIKGVSYLHEVLVVHGDIKPGNILQ